MTKIMDLMEHGNQALVIKCVGVIVDELPARMSSLFIKSIGVQNKEIFCRNKYLNNNVEDRIKLVPQAKNYEQKRHYPNGGNNHYNQLQKKEVYQVSAPIV